MKKGGLMRKHIDWLGGDYDVRETEEMVGWIYVVVEREEFNKGGCNDKHFGNYLYILQKRI